MEEQGGALPPDTLQGMPSRCGDQGMRAIESSYQGFSRLQKPLPPPVQPPSRFAPEGSSTPPSRPGARRAIGGDDAPGSELGAGAHGAAPDAACPAAGPAPSALAPGPPSPMRSS